MDVPTGTYKFAYSQAESDEVKFTVLMSRKDGKLVEVQSFSTKDTNKTIYYLTIPEGRSTYILAEASDKADISFCLLDSLDSNVALREPPSRNGAWLVKNSWGTGKWEGDNGYIWISYESQLYQISSFDTMRANTYDHLYQYDGFNKMMTEYIPSLSHLNPSVELLYENNVDKNMIAETFVAQSDGNIRAIALQSLDTLYYEYQIYTNVADPLDPTSGNPVFPSFQTAGFENGGFKVVELPEGVNAPVLKGERFSIVARVTNTPEGRDNISTTIPASAFTAEDEVPMNVSFFNTGSGWKDTTQNGYLCRLKVFVDDLHATSSEALNDDKMIAPTADEQGVSIMLVLIVACGCSLVLARKR